ncbi:hypothetical protein Slin15195_G065370 [Septoria linicola]|uniref:Uncharacterized protein n=1 Tax=Septoria linicola TaxID=215465 RepID=A0A9Q9AW67_9PEZI|nr:hypothetical protein Slin14017_G115710 [Septoria linicola]USW53218.1 hypothetical protein Slin15195_G065370 [Septoria linicola]
MMTSKRAAIAHKLATLPALPKDKQNGGRGSTRNPRMTDSRVCDANDANKVIRNAKDDVQKLKLEARRNEKRLRRARKRLEKLQPKDKHARIKAWLGLSDREARTTPPVPEARPPFDDKGFPIPNQHWMTASNAPLEETSVPAKKKDYYRAGGKRMPSTDEDIDREGAKKKRKREEAAK